LAFAFSPYMVSQSLGHLHLTLAFFVPLLVVAAHEVLIAQEHSARRGGIVLGLLAGVQALTGEELLAITGVSVAVGAVVLGLLYWREVVPRVVHAGQAIGWALGTFVIIAGVPLAYQVLGPQTIHGSVQPPDLYVTDLYAPVLPTRLQWIHNHWSWAYTQRFGAIGGEWSDFLGVPLILLLIGIVVLFRRHRGVLAAGITALVMLIFSFGPHLHAGGHTWRVPMPWRIVGSVPPLNSVLPARLMVATDFIAAALIGLAAERAWQARGSVRLWALGAIAVAVVFVLPTTKFPSAAFSDPPFFHSKQLAAIPQGSLAIIAPFPAPENAYLLRWQVEAGFRFRMAGGYELVPGDPGHSSFFGPDTATHAVLDSLQGGTPIMNLDFLAVIAMREEMRASGASTVIVGPMTNQDHVITFFQALLGAPPDIRSQGVAMWTNAANLLR
jgi:hypothetical protein